MNPISGSDRSLPLPIARALWAARSEATGASGLLVGRVAGLVDALVAYLSAVAVARYTQSLMVGGGEEDPTLNRSLRSLRRVLNGQRLAWIARGLAAADDGARPAGLAGWYNAPAGEEVAAAYERLRRAMVDHLAYEGEYGPRREVSPRTLLEMVDQYGIRRAKTATESLPPGFDEGVAARLLPGLEAVIAGGGFLWEHPLYAPEQRQLLAGLKPVTPLPPVSVPPDLLGAATLLLYPPGPPPDYTRRPTVDDERLPLFPLDPLMVYTRCEECGRPRVAALQEVVRETALYRGLDADCKHPIRTGAQSGQA